MVQSPTNMQVLLILLYKEIRRTATEANFKRTVLKNIWITVEMLYRVIN